jgi:hypothetical protein
MPSHPTFQTASSPCSGWLMQHCPADLLLLSCPVATLYCCLASALPLALLLHLLLGLDGSWVTVNIIVLMMQKMKSPLQLFRFLHQYIYYFALSHPEKNRQTTSFNDF